MNSLFEFFSILILLRITGGCFGAINMGLENQQEVEEKFINLSNSSETPVNFPLWDKPNLHTICLEVINSFYSKTFADAYGILHQGNSHFAIQFQAQTSSNNTYLALRCGINNNQWELYVFYGYKTRTVFSAVAEGNNRLILQMGLLLNPDLVETGWDDYTQNRNQFYAINPPPPHPFHNMSHEALELLCKQVLNASDSRSQLDYQGTYVVKNVKLNLAEESDTEEEGFIITGQTKDSYILCNAELSQFPSQHKVLYGYDNKKSIYIAAHESSATSTFILTAYATNVAALDF